MTHGPGYIKVQPVELEGFADRIKGSANELNGMLEELRSKLDAIQWTGNDKEAYEIQRTQWQVASGDLNMLLERIGQTVMLARTNYGGTEGTNAKMFQV